MPIYEYRCSKCGTVFELIRSLSLRNHPTMCVRCYYGAELMFSSPGAIRMGHHKALSIDEIQPGEKGGPRCLQS